MNQRVELFLQGYVAGSSSMLLSELQTILKDKFDCEVSLTTIKRQVELSEASRFYQKLVGRILEHHRSCIMNEEDLNYSWLWLTRIHYLKEQQMQLPELNA